VTEPSLPTPIVQRVARGAWKLVNEIVWAYNRDDAGVLAAGLAFYAVISIAPTAILLVALAGAMISQEEAQDQLIQWMMLYVPSDTAQQLEGIIRGAGLPTFDSWTAILTTGVLIFGATRVLSQVQVILNRTLGVRQRTLPILPTIWIFIRKRLVAFSMLGVIAILMFATLVFNSALGVASRYVDVDVLDRIPLGGGVNFTISTVIVGLLMTLVYRWLPDARIAWRDALLGAMVTSLLFNLGRAGLERYLADETTASAFGAAGSVIVLLLWLYYSATMFLIGAAFTDAWARLFGKGVVPDPHAVAVPGHTSDEHDAMSANELPRLDELRWSDSPRPLWSGAHPVDVLTLLDDRARRRRVPTGPPPEGVSMALALARTTLERELHARRTSDNDPADANAAPPPSGV
jgi:membrane protein